MADDPFFNKLNLPAVDNNFVKSLLDDSHNDSAVKDFEKSRSNTLEVLEEVNNSIKDLSQLANSSQHPRIYEVLAKHLDVKINASRQLLELQEKIRKIDQAHRSATENEGDVINNNLYITTAEMLEMLKTTNTKEKIIDTDN